MLKLYRVEILCYVMANDEEDAKTKAAIECQTDDAEAREAVTVESYWSDLIPYNSKDDKCCLDVLREKKATREYCAHGYLVCNICNHNTES